MSRFSPISPYNVPLTVDGRAPKVVFRELTLRQLGHMEADMTLDEKLYFLSRLDHIGVGQITLWGADDDAADIVVQARERGIGIEIALFGKVYFPDEMRAVLVKAKQCGAAFVHFAGRGADYTLKTMKWTRERMLNATVDAVKEAKDRGVAIAVGLSLTTQTELGYLEDYAGAVAAAGADYLHLADSEGVASPHAMRALVSAMRKIAPLPIEVHCHNDFGLAVANNLAAIEAGATVVDVFVNGMDPERCGLASLDEVVMSLEVLYGVDTGIKTEELTALAKLHERLTGMMMPVNKPLVGPRAFNYRAVYGEQLPEARRDPVAMTTVPFDPAALGNTRQFLLGKFSGPNEVKKRLTELGISVSDARLKRLVLLVRQHGTATKAPVSDDYLQYLVQVVNVSVLQ